MMITLLLILIILLTVGIKKSMSQNFQFFSKVGQGAFATVYKVKRKEDSQIYAFKKMKSVKYDERQTISFLNQIRILASLNSQYVIKYKQAFFDTGLKCLCLITQFAEGGDLSGKINNCRKNKEQLSQNFIWRTTLQLLHGIKALHKMMVFHRDIKPANVLLSKNGECAKLADMNVSVISKTGLAQTQTGTPYYSSPQVWLQKPYTGKSDIWSLGCVIYQMATFRPPFMASQMLGLRKKIIEAQYQPIPYTYSKELQMIIKICLQKQQKLRLNVNQILNLPFVKQKMKSFPNQKFNQKYFPPIQKSMIRTIKIDRNNLRSVQNKLPKCNYDILGKENKENQKSEQNKIKNNLSCVSKNASKQGLHQKLPQIKRPVSTNKKQEKVIMRREVLIKLRS